MGWGGPGGGLIPVGRFWCKTGSFTMPVGALFFGAPLCVHRGKIHLWVKLFTLFSITSSCSMGEKFITDLGMGFVALVPLIVLLQPAHSMGAFPPISFPPNLSTEFSNLILPTTFSTQFSTMFFTNSFHPIFPPNSSNQFFNTIFHKSCLP